MKGSLAPKNLKHWDEAVADTTDPTKAKRLTEEMVRGFYGGEAHA